MNVITVVILLVSLVSCAQHTLTEEKKDLPSFLSHHTHYSKRSPAQAKKIENLEEFIQAFLEVASRKKVPVGYEEVESRFANGKTSISRTVYLKQNEHGYFDLTWSEHRDGELTSHNFETDHSSFVANIRRSAKEGRITKISKLKDGVYEIKGVHENNNFCTVVFDLNVPTYNDVCVNSQGEVISKREQTLKKVDLSAFEDILRDTKLTICSNVLSNGNTTTCELTESSRDWWEYLFEEE